MGMQILNQEKTLILRGYVDIFVRECSDEGAEVVASYIGDESVLVVLGKYKTMERAKEVLGTLARGISIGLHMFRMPEK